MVNWQDPGVIERCMTGFVDINLLLLGFYGWYYLHSFQVETALLRRQLPFQWSMVSYVVGRIFFLLSLTLSAISSGPLMPYLDCDDISKFLAYSGNVVVACASTNLVILTWTVWRRHRSVCLLLAFVTLGHWLTLIIDSWGSRISPTPGRYGFSVVNHLYSGVAATYTTIFNFFLLKLTILGLWRSSPSFSLRISLRSHGIIYFFIVFFASIIPLIFSWLDLNYIMNIIFAYPASCVMTIASSRALNAIFNLPPAPSSRTPVVVLPELKKENVEVTTAESPASGLA